MCDPMIGGAISVMTNAMSSMLAIQAQNKQADYQNALRANNIKQAKKTHATGQHLINKGLVEQEQAALAKAEELQLETMRAKGFTEAGAENQGMSLNALMRDYDRQKSRYLGNIDMNLKNARAQGAAEKEGVSADAAAMIDSVAPAAKAGNISTVVSTLGTALDAYSIYWHKPKLSDIGTAKKG